MTTCFWDMDHTLINNDCDVSWKEFLVVKGLAEPAQLELVDEYYRQYEAGVLKTEEFMAFQLKEFAGRSREEIRRLCTEHFESVVKPTIYPLAIDMLREQQQTGTDTVLLTATNREIAFPVANFLGFERVIASDLEIEGEVFTGKPTGIYCCGEGKLERLKIFCEENNLRLQDSHYFGDSLSDVHVLRAVGYPHAVNPMPKLRAEAEEKGWDILTF